MRRVKCFGACIVGASLFFLSACSGESRREATQDPAATAATAATTATTATTESAATAADAPPGQKPAVPGQWTRIAVVDAKLETRDGQSTLLVRIKTPTPGWKVEVRPLPVTDPGVSELEVVGRGPEGPAATVATVTEERTVTHPIHLGDKANQPVLVHGAGAAIFAQ